MNRTTRTLATTAALTVVTLTGAQPAEAAPTPPTISRVQPASLASREFVVVGHLGGYYAHGYRNGVYVWSGPKRFWKSQATHDGLQWVAGA